MMQFAGTASTVMIFWAGVIWIVYVYLGYPACLKLIGLVRRIHLEARDDYLPTVSVLIAARNEEKDIEWKVKETLNWDYPGERLEVLVASDASDDHTDEILLQISDTRLTCVRMEKRGGKNAALNRLAGLAKGDLLFFTDANAHLGPGCLRSVVRHFANPRVGCVTGGWQPLRERLDHAVAKGARAYWGYESMVKSLESRIGSVLVCIGSVFCMRRSLFSPLHPDLANDLESPLRVGHAGYWLLHEPKALVFEKDTRSPREEFERRRRITAQGMLGFLTLRNTLRGLRAWQFVSAKLLRWFTLVPLLLILVSTASRAASPLFGMLLWLQIIFYALALVGLLLTVGGRKAGRAFAFPFYFVLVPTASLLGVVDALRGKRFSVWEIPSLARGPLGTGADMPSAADGLGSCSASAAERGERS